ncbi:MAG TPA: hypothetical protein VF970_05235 [Gemmatimonadales bacterium]
MRTLKLFSSLAVLPVMLAAQQVPTDRLREVLPANVSDQVIAIVTDATAHGLPGRAIADRVLEGIAKGRSGEEVRAAALALAADLAGAHGALVGAGRTPDASEIEAGATAMSLGVDGATVSALAQSAPSGRSLAVPLAVIGALVNRELPADDALQAVLDRLNARASESDLTEMPGEAGQLIAQGYRPSDVGPALRASRPAGVPANSGRPGARPQRPGRVP